MKKTATKPQNRDFIRVGRSRIEGRGVFAKRSIPKGTRIVEYTGEHVAVTRYLVAISEGKAASIYAFRLNDSIIIDGAVGGNDSRFINHSCEPNCEAYVFDDKAYVYAMRDITRGEELTFDYQLQRTVRSRVSKSDKEQYRCFCGSLNCRGSMIALSRKTHRR